MLSDPTVMQLILAIVGSLSVWALKSVVEQRTQIAELKGTQAALKLELDAMKNAIIADKTHLNYRLDELKGLTAALGTKFDRLTDRRQSQKNELPSLPGEQN